MITSPKPNFFSPWALTELSEEDAILVMGKRSYKATISVDKPELGWMVFVIFGGMGTHVAQGGTYETTQTYDYTLTIMISKRGDSQGYDLKFIKVLNQVGKISENIFIKLNKEDPKESEVIATPK
jgi:hypothetical protein